MSSRTKRNHHTRQLCRQVAEAVDLALQCDLQDECLAKLRVLEVRPTGRASRLEVVVAAQVEDLAELGELSLRLNRLQGFLRRAVSREIHRKRTPNLRLVLVPDPD